MWVRRPCYLLLWKLLEEYFLLPLQKTGCFFDKKLWHIVDQQDISSAKMGYYTENYADCMELSLGNNHKKCIAPSVYLPDIYFFYPPECEFFTWSHIFILWHPGFPHLITFKSFDLFYFTVLWPCALYVAVWQFCTVYNSSLIWLT